VPPVEKLPLNENVPEKPVSLPLVEKSPPLVPPKLELSPAKELEPPNALVPAMLTPPPAELSPPTPVPALDVPPNSMITGGTV
jgi:hypothetical protein